MVPDPLVEFGKIMYPWGRATPALVGQAGLSLAPSLSRSLALALVVFHHLFSFFEYAHTRRAHPSLVANHSARLAGTSVVRYTHLSVARSPQVISVNLTSYTLCMLSANAEMPSSPLAFSSVLPSVLSFVQIGLLTQAVGSTSIECCT